MILSDDAVRIRKIDNFVKDMEVLYEQHDERILDLFSQEYLRETKDMGTAILQDMKRFNKISLSLFIDRIEIYKENLSISLQWDGAWEDSEKTYREGGSMVLITSYGDDIRITGIRGDSPFGVSQMINRHED